MIIIEGDLRREHKISEVLCSITKVESLGIVTKIGGELLAEKVYSLCFLHVQTTQSSSSCINSFYL